MKLTQKQVEQALKKLSDGWPDDLWIFAANGSFCLMECGTDKKRAMLPSEGYDSAYIVECYLGIDCDGGDW